MSTTNGVARYRREEPTYKLDFSKPINTTTMTTKDGDCFGLEWDMTTKECATCADNEVCGIKFGDALRVKAKETEEIEKFLDVSDFTLVKEERIKIWLGLKERTTDELLDKVMEMAKTTDEVAAAEWIKRFFKAHNYGAKNGVVYEK